MTFQALSGVTPPSTSIQGFTPYRDSRIKTSRCSTKPPHSCIGSCNPGNSKLVRTASVLQQYSAHPRVHSINANTVWLVTQAVVSTHPLQAHVLEVPDLLDLALNKLLATET
jgi:hypothetical protein